MFGTILLEDFTALPDKLVFDVIGEHILHSINYKMLEYDAERMKETLDKIDNTIIKPILVGSVEEMEGKLERSLSPFYLELVKLNMLMLASQRYKSDVSESMVETVDLLFKKIEEFVTIQTRYMEINEHVTANILGLSSQLRSYDNIVLAIAFTEPGTLAEALNVVDISELRRSLSGATLVFLCILTYLRNQIRDPEKLAKLVKMDEEYTDVIGSWAAAIGILGTPKEEIKTITEPLPIAEGVGTIKKSGLDIDLSKMEKGKSYAINFRSSRYELEKDEKGHLIVKEVGRDLINER